jgi:hypothetical protein
MFSNISLYDIKNKVSRKHVQNFPCTKILPKGITGGG